MVLAMGFSVSPSVFASYVGGQSGSLLGLAHVSVGEDFFENHYFSAGIGYVPKLSEHHEMSMFSLSYRYQNPQQFSFQVAKRQWSLSVLNFGVSALVGNHDALFTRLPDQYPDDYYQPTAIRLIFNYQSILKVSNTMEFYFDISMLDVGLVTYVREPEFFMDNYDYLGLEGVTNWGLGVRHFF